ncbi:MAG: hypothetical protein LBF12_03400 [Christensenellaceae bacterium]|nr:hypothetical protein [Christensenellaceae bacterium]
MLNKERVLVRSVKEICEKHKIEFELFAYGWVIRLSFNNKEMYIYGYQFPINNAVADALCCDKSATYELLSKRGISAVEHYYFTSPEWKHYTGCYDDEEKLLKLLEKHKRIVLKPNEGTAGDGVCFVDNLEELQKAREKIFKRTDSMAVCIYYSIKDEYRCIVLNNKAKIIFKKMRPAVLGDGVSDIRTLIDSSSVKVLDINKEINFEYVPMINERVEISLKHNLGLGAHADSNINKEIKVKIAELASNASAIIGIKFASIDIIDTMDGLKILEINSGVMAENYASQSDENYSNIKALYEEVILKYFNES